MGTDCAIRSRDNRGDYLMNTQSSIIPEVNEPNNSSTNILDTDTTTYSTVYESVFERKLNIFNNLIGLNEIKDDLVKSNVYFFMEVFENKIRSLSNYILNKRIVLPKLSMDNIESDDSVLISWNFKNFKIHFSFEKEESQSFWSVLSNGELDYNNSSGMMTHKNIEEILESLIIFAIKSFK